MAEAQQKRHRDDCYEAETNPDSKRQKPFHSILSLLEEEETEQGQGGDPAGHDLSAIFTTLQRELSSSTGESFADFNIQPCVEGEDELGLGVEHLKSADSAASGVGSPSSGDVTGDDGGVKSVMRHLFEASDDELGIPNREDGFGGLSSGLNIPSAVTDGGFWELDDEAANYYSVLQSQSELFLE